MTPPRPKEPASPPAVEVEVLPRPRARARAGDAAQGTDRAEGERSTHEVPVADRAAVEQLRTREAAAASDGDAGGDPQELVVAGDALADIDAATDEELDAIERELRRRASAAAAAEAGTTTALARRDPLSVYMSEVRRYPLLTREEERELAVRWVETGDPEAGRRLITSNLRLVVKLAHQYRRAYHNLLDLVQEGNVGLVKAVQKFDPYRGVKLSTYSGWWIRAYILKYLLNNASLVKLGTTQNQRKLFFNLRKQRAQLVAAGIDPTPERIADALDVSTAEVVEMEKRMAAPDLSLDAPLTGDDGEGTRTRLDLIQDGEATPEGSVDAAEFRELLQSKLRSFGATLEGRELEIFVDRVMADEPITLQDLGARWGVSRERARQLEKRMLLRLREFLQQELGDAVEIALGHD
jgi:RNA polymerase sigma-32 factor